MPKRTPLFEYETFSVRKAKSGGLRDLDWPKKQSQ